MREGKNCSWEGEGLYLSRSSYQNQRGEEKGFVWVALLGKKRVWAVLGWILLALLAGLLACSRSFVPHHPHGAGFAKHVSTRTSQSIDTPKKDSTILQVRYDTYCTYEQFSVSQHCRFTFTAITKN